MPVPDPSLNYDDLLETVRESERGRWFLAEFETRLRKSDSGNILAAIARLEDVIAGQSQSGIDSLLVARARTAIAAARREIAHLDSSAAHLSDEGRLFAKLADMARTAFATGASTNTVVNAGVGRALLLVDQLDQDFAAAPSAEALPPVLAPHAEVFEAPPPRLDAPKAAPAIPAKPADVERGAKLVIRKAGDTAAPQAPVAAPETPAAVAAPEPAVAAQPVAMPEPAAARSSRVVIIRRKPEELLDVPLMDDAATETAA